MTKENFIEELAMIWKDIDIDKASEFYDKFLFEEKKAKPLITPKGLKVLEFLNQNPKDMYTSKMIGEALSINSRSVSGTMRKLVTDGYVDKKGNSPIAYLITEKGKAFILDNDKNL